VTSRGRGGGAAQLGAKWVTLAGKELRRDDITAAKSRKGEPGIVLQPGAKATFHTFRARRLR
jgi:hypothetical protein